MTYIIIKVNIGHFKQFKYYAANLIEVKITIIAVTNIGITTDVTNISL